MLPGFRFIFTSVILCVSVVIFGLGAAGLLRSTHEKFATLQIRRADPAMFTAQPALAMLRVEPAVTDTGSAEPARDAPVEVPKVTPIEIENVLDSALTSPDVTGPRTAPDHAAPAVTATIAPAAPIAAPPALPMPELSAPPETVAAAAPPEVSAPAELPPAIAPPATIDVPVEAAPTIPDNVTQAPPAPTPMAPPTVTASLATPAAPAKAAMTATPVADLPDLTGTDEALIAASDVKLPRERPKPVDVASKAEKRAERKARLKKARKERSERSEERPAAPAQPATPPIYRAAPLSFG